MLTFGCETKRCEFAKPRVADPLTARQIVRHNTRIAAPDLRADFPSDPHHAPPIASEAKQSRIAF